jgi:prepilin-type N-terminal cleavage/methylation domain-containing protein
MARRRRAAGFSLVELMIVVAIVGVLASIAVPAFGRYIRRARTAEAAGHLNKMWAGAVAYYLNDHTTAEGKPLPRQFPGPKGAAEVEGECGCQPGGLCGGKSPVWNTPIWEALAFSLPDPHAYAPRFESSGAGNAAAFTARATGDLDCDGVVATFERRGAFDPALQDIAGHATPIVTFETE